MRAFVLVVLLLGNLAAAAASKNDEVDYLGLATLLTRDGEYARAEQALANIDPTAEGVDLIQYHTVRGLLALEQQKMAEAVAGFNAAIAAGQTDPLVRSEEHTSELQSLMRISYAVFCLKKKTQQPQKTPITKHN